MSQNTTARRAFPSPRDSNNSQINPSGINISNPHLQFQDPQTLSFYRQNGSNSVRKINTKPTIDFNATHTALTLENFLPYANISSNKPKGIIADNERNVKAQTKIVLKNEIEKSNEMSAQPVIRDKENSAAISNRFPKTISLNTNKDAPVKTMVVKAVKANHNYKSPHRNDEADTQDDSDDINDREITKEKEVKNSAWQQTKRENNRKISSHEEKQRIMVLPEDVEENKFEFTLGGFKPGARPLDKSNEPLRASRESSFNDNIVEEKPKRRSRIEISQEGQRIQTEAADHKRTEKEVIAPAPKPNQSLGQNELNQMISGRSEPSFGNLKSGLDAVKQKGPSDTTKINQLEEQIMLLRNENMRQSEAIDLLIDLVKENKKSPKNYTMRNSELSLNNRSHAISQSKLYPEIESEKKQPVNLYRQQNYLETGYETNKRSQRPPPLDEETPCFGSTFSKPKNDSSFTNLFLSPVRHVGKAPKVNDPTRQERVYSSPISSFVERNHILPLIPDVRSTKSGTAEANSRNLEYIRDANIRKGPSAFKNPGENSESRYGFDQGKPPLRNMSKPSKIVSVSDKDDSSRYEGEIKRKEMGQSTLSLLPGIGKYLSENTAGNRLDSLDQLRFANDLKKHHIRDPDGTGYNGDLQNLPQHASDSKSKGKILKEVFNLNWKKKCCI